MMSYEEISSTMRAFLGGREAFRRLGFEPEDLFCHVGWSARFDCLSCFVVLRVKSEEFFLEVGEVESQDTFEAEYKRVTLAVNSGEVSDEDCNRIWFESEVCQKWDGFLAAVLKRGFKPPKVSS